MEQGSILEKNQDDFEESNVLNRTQVSEGSTDQDLQSNQHQTQDVQEVLEAIGHGSNVLDAQFIDSYEIFGNADYISQYNSVDGDGQCIEEIYF